MIQSPTEATPRAFVATYPWGMNERERVVRLGELAAFAVAAEARGDGWAAGETWRSYELVRDGGRDPDELLAEGIALCRVALDLAEPAEQVQP